MKKPKKKHGVKKTRYRIEYPGNSQLLRQEITKVAKALCTSEEVKRIEEFISGRGDLSGTKKKKI